MSNAANSPSRLSHDARAIWQAGVDAVRSERLVGQVIERTPDELVVVGRRFPLASLGRIAVVGAGKAGAGMAAAVEAALGADLVDRKVVGWLNVPADCVRPLRKVHLHAARPAGVNEPTPEGVEGARRILEIVSQLESRDLCLCLLSGGGSALLPAPVSDISLADKQAVTRFLMQAGAPISELNTVRKRLSQIKGGGLARALHAGTLITLIISDVVGDPLDIIASGPTVSDPGTAADALAVLEKRGACPPAVPQAVFDCLRRQPDAAADAVPLPTGVSNIVVGNNAVALVAAERKAVELGYRVYSLGSENQGDADTVGRELARLCRQIRDECQPVDPPACVLSGGEPVVHLVRTDAPRKGGRNQQLVLSALTELWNDGMAGIALLSGGTDGEDGPTDAAGAWADADVISAARSQGLRPIDDLQIQNAYHFFTEAGGLLKTGPTHTNVMDLRVGLVRGS